MGLTRKHYADHIKVFFKYTGVIRDLKNQREAMTLGIYRPMQNTFKFFESQFLNNCVPL